MKLKSFLITLSIWLLFSWPLPKYISSAVPAGTTPPSHNYAIVPMAPGDHLQLLYHFWLFSDFVTGHTPWFHNLYEFNTGDDEARFEPGSYYFPFSLFFAAGKWMSGSAFGWNLAGFLSLWLTYFFTWRLARRYCDSDGWAALAAIVSITFPYRWINLTGGSPTGFGMMWVPALLWGLDAAVRDLNWRGGLLAGVAILMASWGDTHVFYFCGLMIPIWCLVAFIKRDSFARRESGRLMLALLAVPLFAAAAVLSSTLMTKGIASSHAEGGRAIREVALFSPKPSGLFAWEELGVSNHIYLGFTATALLAAGLLIFLLRFKKQKRQAFVYFLLALGVVVIVMLSLGPFGPFDGRPFTAARKFIPQYTMIRQPAKIFCLLPTLLAVAFAMLTVAGPARKFVLFLLVASVFEFNARFMPTLCPLDRSQAAYKAVADAGDEKPRALVLPLWPGDSHYTSVYQYYASLYRIRLVNGYRAFVPQAYIDDVFHRFESANLGSLSDEQLAALQEMGVQNVILHEDLFPEKVSPYPVGFTLKNLLNHPRLTLLKHDGTAWAFRIEQQPKGRPQLADHWRYLFPSRQFTADRMKVVGDKLMTRATLAVPAPSMRWMLRVRGPGRVDCGMFVKDQPASFTTFELVDNRWKWVESPLPAWDGQQSVYALVKTEKAVLDRLLLAAGEWPKLQPGESVDIPAPCFFHAGYTDLKTDSVVIRKNRERREIVFYGPKLPLDVGTYRVEVEFLSDAENDSSLGDWIITCPEGHELKRLDVRAGHPLETDFRVDENLPLLLAFQFHGGGDISFNSVRLSRID